MIANTNINLPGPDKGLVDVLMGSNQNQTTPAELNQGAIDFTKILKEAQDQKLAKDGNLSKEDEKVKDKDKTSSENKIDLNALMQLQAQMQQAQTPTKVDVTATKSKEPGSEKAKTSESAELLNKTATATDGKTMATAAALANGVATKSTSTASTKDEKVAKEASRLSDTTIDSRTGKPMNAGAAKTNSSPNASSLASVLNGLTSGGAASLANSKMDSAQGVVNQNPGAKVDLNALINNQTKDLLKDAKTSAANPTPLQVPIVVQPVVIQQAPLFVESLDLDSLYDDYLASGSSDLKGGNAELGLSSAFMAESSKDKINSSNRPLILSSQDYLSNKGSVLGVDKADPRLLGRVEKKLNNDSKSESNLNGFNFAHLNQAQPVINNDVALFKPLDMATAAKVSLNDSTALAMQVSRLASQGGGTVRMKVVPESLGEVTIQVSAKQGQLNVQFETNNDQAKELLRQSMPELKAALASSQYKVGDLEVRNASQNSGTWTSNGLSFLDLAPTNWNQNLDSQSDWKQGQERYQDRYNDLQERRDQSSKRDRSGYDKYQQASWLS